MEFIEPHFEIETEGDAEQRQLLMETARTLGWISKWMAKASKSEEHQRISISFRRNVFPPHEGKAVRWTYALEQRRLVWFAEQLAKVAKEMNTIEWGETK